ncbi:MAG: hypothetical protein ABSF84_05490 [Acidimicrobiales bacterium]|jgi:tetratricopeptide (TPR) repeat protein
MTASALLEMPPSEAVSASPAPPPSLHLLETQPALADASDEEPSELVHARTLAESHSSSAIVQARLAQALHCYGRTAEAVKVASHAAMLGRDTDPSAVTMAALVLLTGGELASAESVLGRQSTPTARFIFALCAVHRMDYDKAFARLKDLKSYEARSLAGWLHLQRFEFREAVHAYREALEVGEATPDVMVNLAYSHASIGNKRAAARAAAVAVGLAPADRLASMNLLLARMNCGDVEGALEESTRIERRNPNDLMLPIARFAVLKQSGRTKEAYRVVRSLRNERSFWNAPDNERAELKGLLTVIDLQQGKIDKNTARKHLQKLLVDSDFQQLTAARALTCLYSRHSEAGLVGELVDQLAQHHRPERIYWAKARLAFLELDFESSLELARKWLLVEPLDPAAASHVQYLLTDYSREYSEAIAVGKRFLRRQSEREIVLNNTAYAMIMAGQTSEARVLLSEALESPMSIATEGLLSIREGRRKEGSRLYDLAAKMAKSTGDSEVALLLMARKLVALGEDPSGAQFSALRDDARFLVMTRGG